MPDSNSVDRVLDSQQAAHKAEVHSSTLQLAEKQSVIEGQQAEIGELEQRLTGSVEQVSAVQQKKASAAQAHSAASQEAEEEQEGKAAAAEVVLLQTHKCAVQQLTSQLSASTFVTTEQKAELSKKEAQVQRLDDNLSEQQTKMTQLQSLLLADKSEVQRLGARLVEMQVLVEGKQAAIENLESRLTTSTEEVSAVHKELAGAQGTYNTDAQVNDELDAEKLHPQLHHSETRAGASSLRKNDSLSSELVSRGRALPYQTCTGKQAGTSRPTCGPAIIPSDADVSEQSKSGGVQDSEANRGSNS
ncbi:TPA: hypothetical protein ACH3X1_008467 [Trebouxia sp. C0004]